MLSVFVFYKLQSLKTLSWKPLILQSTIGPKLSADGSAAFRNLRTYVVRWCLEVTFSPCFRCRYGASELHSVAAFIGGKANILPLLLNWAHQVIQVMISGRVGQPSHRTVYLTPTAICFWKYLMIVKKLNAPKPDTKTPENQQVEKTGNVYLQLRQWCHPRGFRAFNDLKNNMINTSR